MFVRLVIDEVRRALDKMEFKYDELVFVKLEGDVYILHCYNKEKRYVVRRYEKEKFEDIKVKYDLVEKYGITSVRFIVENNLIIYEDLTNGEEIYRLPFAPNKRVFDGMILKRVR